MGEKVSLNLPISVRISELQRGQSNIIIARSAKLQIEARELGAGIFLFIAKTSEVNQLTKKE